MLALCLSAASLTDWDHHLAKPFSVMEETPTLLASVAVLLQALRLTPGMTVLEFGAGTGWLSRFLTQMGMAAPQVPLTPPASHVGSGAPSTPAAPSLPDRLASLAKLRADGVLTEEEFSAAKRRLLDLDPG